MDDGCIFVDILIAAVNSKYVIEFYICIHTLLKQKRRTRKIQVEMRSLILVLHFVVLQFVFCLSVDAIAASVVCIITRKQEIDRFVFVVVNINCLCRIETIYRFYFQGMILSNRTYV